MNNTGKGIFLALCAVGLFALGAANMATGKFFQTLIAVGIFFGASIVAWFGFAFMTTPDDGARE